MLTQSAVSQTPYQKWYKNNKEILNEKRRKKYAKDQIYRNKQLAMARVRRQKLRAEKATQWEGLTTPQVATLVGRKAQTIRTWEKRGIIPTPPQTDHGVRMYKPHHVTLLKDMVDLMDTYFTTSRNEFNGRMKTMIDHIKESW
jgi:hypothetical protein